MKKLATLSVVAAASLWGLMGIFVRHFSAAGLGSLETTEVRMLCGLVLVGLYLALFRRDKLRVRLRDLWCFVGTGIVSLLFFSWCYFQTMTLTSLAVAGVLLYTAPVFVMLLSALLFRERITPSKAAALLMAVAGCALLCDWKMVGAAASVGPSFFWWVAAMGLLTAFAAYLLYTWGLERIESSRAAILASVEPVVAALVGIFLFHETVSLPAVAGIVLVLGAIVVLSRGKTVNNS